MPPFVVTQARFIGLLALLLYWVHMAERAKRSVADKQLGSLLCAVQTHFARVRERVKGKRSLLLTLLPLLLLSVRMACEAIFRQAFPKWWTTRDARGCLAEMDAFIEQLLDPNKYHSHLATLESSTEAIRIAAREELGVKYRSRGARFYATSTLVSSALPRGHGVWQHRQIAGASLPPAASHVAQLSSGAVQEQLFQTAINTRAPPRDPLLRAAAAPAGGLGATAGGSRGTLRGSAPRLGGVGSTGNYGTSSNERAIAGMIERPAPRSSAR